VKIQSSSPQATRNQLRGSLWLSPHGTNLSSSQSRVCSRPPWIQPPLIPPIDVDALTVDIDLELHFPTVTTNTCPLSWTYRSVTFQIAAPVRRRLVALTDLLIDDYLDANETTIFSPTANSFCGDPRPTTGSREAGTLAGYVLPPNTELTLKLWDTIGIRTEATGTLRVEPF
jgi:hypothetical protein